MEQLREQIEQLRPAEQEHVFSLILNENIPFQRSKETVMVCLSKTPPSCIEKIKDYLLRLKDAAASVPVVADHDVFVGGVGCQGVSAVGVCFEEDENSASSDEETIAKKLRFTDVQKSIRQKMRCTQRVGTKTRKPSGRKDYGEKISSNGVDDDEDLADADVPDDTEVMTQCDDITNADEAASVDFDESVVEAPDTEAPEDEDDDQRENFSDHEESFIDDFSELKDPTVDSSYKEKNRRFNFANRPVPDRLSYYVPILEKHGYSFGNLASFGYPLSVCHDEG